MNGVFPDILKTANIIPLFKKEDSMLFSNYRPVSLLCTLSKLLEKIMYNKVIDFLKEHDILFKYPFGFRQGYSTYLALTVLVDKLVKSLENGDYVVGVFLDFSKAFDTVDHEILLAKLQCYGLRGIASQWYYTLIFPYLTYCNQVWGSTYKYNIDTLTKFQKKAVKIICSVKPFSHTDGLYKELGLLKVTDIYHFLVGQFMFRYHHKMLPKLFDEYFTKRSKVYGYITRQSELFRLPDYKKDLGRRCISFAGVKMWKKNCCCWHRLRYITTSV